MDEEFGGVGEFPPDFWTENSAFPRCGGAWVITETGETETLGGDEMPGMAAELADTMQWRTVLSRGSVSPLR